MTEAMEQHQIDELLLEIQSEEAAREHLRQIHSRTDRLFAGLMALQFLAAVLAAVIITPRTWIGAESSVHVHVYSAIAIGGTLAAFPIFLALRCPGKTITRHTIAVAQVMFSGLFIHLSGGRIETHFHVFGSLAFLAFYRDWRVLVPATAVVAVDHLVRGVFWPESVFGVIAAAPWRAFEHAGWVLFEDIFLAYSCIRGAREVRIMAERRTRLELVNATIEKEVFQRTQELQAQTDALTREMEERKLLENQLVEAQKLESIGQLAAGIAHEINTPTQYVSDNTRFLEKQFSNMMRVLDRYAEQIDPDAPAKSWQERTEEIRTTLKEVKYDFLRQEIPAAIDQSLEGLDRISKIVRAMKDFSHPGSEEKEEADLNQAIDSTVTVCHNRWKYAADMDLELDPALPPVPCHLAEFNQVILNLVVNAADAIHEHAEGAPGGGRIVIRTAAVDGAAEVHVSDNGGGIPDDIRENIFDPFFTTKDVGKGTGQGLAISRDIITKKHGGQLRCDTVPGEGTTFVIRLPLDDAEPLREAA